MAVERFLYRAISCCQGLGVKKTTFIFLVVLLLLATLLRLYGLDAKSLWQDEITTLKHATSGDATDVLSSVLDKSLPAPPLYFMVIHIVSFMGQEDFLLRFPSFLFGVLSVAAVYKLGSVLFGNTEGVIGAFLLTLSPFHVRYSQEARAYALLMLLSVLALVCLWKGMRGREWRWWIGFVICNVLNLYTHLLALVVLAAEVLIYLSLLLVGLGGRPPEARRTFAKELLAFWVSTAGIVGCYLPMLPYLWQGITGGKGLGDVDFTPGMSLTPSFFAQVFSLYGAGSGVALIAFGVAFVAGLVWALRKDTPQGLLALVWIGVPFGLLFALPAKHGFRPRYLIFIVPLYLVVVAKGVTTLGELASHLVEHDRDAKRRGIYAAWLLGSVTLFGLVGFCSLLRYYLEPRADWRAASAFLVHNMGSADIVYSPRALPRIALTHYRHELLEAEFVQDRDGRVDPLSLLDEGGVWIVAAGQSAFPLAEQVRGGRDARVLEVVYGVDQDLATQAVADGIAPAMFKEIWIAYVREGADAEDIIALYEDALSTASRYDSVGIHNSLGDLLFEEGRVDEAIYHFQEAVRLDAHSARAHHGLAQAYEEKGWSQLAAREWQTYTELTEQ